MSPIDWRSIFVAVLCVTGLFLPLRAQDQKTTTLGAMQPADATQEPAAATQPSADDVMRQLLLDRREPLLVRPAASGPDSGSNSIPSAAETPVKRPPAYEIPELPVIGVTIDPAVLGPAPGAQQPPLRREGEFIFSRHGRIVYTDTGQQIFVFEADSQEVPEPPMILQPCRLLQSMEDIIQRRGDTVVFVLSGQVHVYRGANYLLPTMMRITLNRSNLE